MRHCGSRGSAHYGDQQNWEAHLSIQRSEPCSSLASPDDSLWLRGSDYNITVSAHAMYPTLLTSATRLLAGGHVLRRVLCQGREQERSRFRLGHSALHNDVLCTDFLSVQILVRAAIGHEG